MYGCVCVCMGERVGSLVVSQTLKIFIHHFFVVLLNICLFVGVFLLQAVKQKHYYEKFPLIIPPLREIDQTII